MKDNVREMKVIMPDASLLTLNSGEKRASGYDIKDLFIGSEGEKITLV